jgi:hypothetical protein
MAARVAPEGQGAVEEEGAGAGRSGFVVMHDEKPN